MAMLAGYAVHAQTGAETGSFPGDAGLTEDPGPIRVTSDDAPVELEGPAARSAQLPIDLVPVGDLVRAAAAGDQRAWSELVARFSGMRLTPTHPTAAPGDQGLSVHLWLAAARETAATPRAW